MTAPKSFFMFLILMLFLKASLFASDSSKISEIKSEVKEKEEKKIIIKKGASHKHSDAIDDLSGSIFGNLFLWLILMPYYAPYNSLDAGPIGGFNQYPYQDNALGYMEWDQLSDSRPFGFEGYSEAFWLTDHLIGFENSLLLSTVFRVDIKYTWQAFYEDLPSSKFDYFHLHHGVLLFRFAQNEKLQFRSGLGVSNAQWSDEKADWGYFFHYGVNFYPVKPFSGSVTFDYGSLGQTHLLKCRVAIAWQFRFVALNASFLYMTIGDEEFFGPGLGLKLNF